jgi:ATP sulfurylase
MAQPRTKQVDLKGRKFELRRLSPEVGTFILMRMMGVQMRREAAQEERAPAKPAVKLPEISGEARVRALSFIVFSGAISFEDFKFIQNACMHCVSIVKVAEGEAFPMPIMSDAGEWTKDGQAVVDDVQLLMNLTTETLVLSYADFFEQGSAV